MHTRACTQASVSCVCVHHCVMPCAGMSVPELGCCPLVGVGIALGLQGGPPGMWGRLMWAPDLSPARAPAVCWLGLAVTLVGEKVTGTLLPLLRTPFPDLTNHQLTLGKQDSWLVRHRPLTSQSELVALAPPPQPFCFDVHALFCGSALGTRSHPGSGPRLGHQQMV